MASTAIPTGSQALRTSAFGDLVVAENTPQVQIQFPYNINPEIVTANLNNGGTATIVNSKAQASTGTNTNSYAAIFSRKTVRYRPGTGVIVKFTALFTTGVANSTQNVGFGQAEDGLFFGFNGTNFGILRRDNGVSHIEEFTITGAATSTADVTITLDGDTKAVAVVNLDSATEVARKIKATDFSQVGAGWDVFIAGAIIEFTSFLTGVRAGSFTLSGAGVTATNTTVLTGVAVTETFTNQSDWSEDVMDGSGDNNPSRKTLDPTKGNVYAIQFQWLGFGALKFFIEDEESGNFIEVHRIKYANKNTIPSMRNPSLPLCLEVINTSNTSDIKVQSSSMAGFVEGRNPLDGTPHSEETVNTGITTTENAIITIHSRPTFQGVSNRTAVRPTIITLATDGNKIATFRAYINAILGGTPSFSVHDATSSVISFDTAATTVSGGEQIASIQLPKAGSDEINLGDLNIEIEPGDSLTITGVFNTGGSGELSASIGWKEEL